jgi:hypothetical protein
VEDEIPADDSLALGRLVGTSKQYLIGTSTRSDKGAMMRMRSIVSLYCVLLVGTVPLVAQGSQRPQNSASKPADPAPRNETVKNAYSGMYTFLEEGEFVQLTVEDEGRVTGFISRFGNGESDKGVFLDQFFKSGKLDGNNLSFSTQLVHGYSFDFKGLVERGEGKNPGDDSYFVLKGILTENLTDENKKMTSKPRNVVFKMFPQDVTPSPDVRK